MRPEFSDVSFEFFPFSFFSIYRDLDGVLFRVLSRLSLSLFLSNKNSNVSQASRLILDDEVVNREREKERGDFFS